MLVVGIDPGSRSGWSVVEDGKLRRSGSWQLSLGGDSRPGQRFRRFRCQLLALLEEHAPVALLAYELRAGQGKGSAAQHIHGGLVAHAEELAESHGVAYTSVHPSTLKLWATGHGHAKKPDMMAAAQRLTGYDVTDDNEADAILVALHTYETCKGKL